MKVTTLGLVCATSLATALLSTNASAALIAGNMSFNGGSVQLLTAGGLSTTIVDSTPVGGLEFVGTAAVSPTGTDGNYSGAVDSIVDFAANPFLFAKSGLLWTAGEFSFFVSSTTAIKSGNTLTIYGTGIVKAQNYTETPGTWILTTNGSTLQGLSWSSSIGTPDPTSKVPDGGAGLVLLGASLVGLHGLRLKFRKD
ncbi:MAG: hypothetical protein EOP85_04825 [Verrucomicrobiaceae bacterium]|nr:MAG: hypothetical protein EOP85_04825 [Verrucomicrobiaceae bacterium]